MNRLTDFYMNSGADALLLIGGSNIWYATGYKADYAYVIMTKSAVYYFTDGRFTLEAKAFLTKEYKIVEVNTLDVFTKIRDVLDYNGIKTIAFDADISHYQYILISQELDRYALIDVTDKIAVVRAIKAGDEINNIVTAQCIAEKSLTELLPSIVLGVTEIELAARLEYLMRINGSTGASFDSIVAFGANSAFAHAKPSNNKLKKGDIILIDFGATYNGYCSDMTRTFAYDHATDQVTSMYEAVLAANNRAIETIKVGMTTKQIDAVARDILAEYGYANYFNHSLGHGVGIDIHEFPSLSPRAEESILSSGMVVTIEPGVYLDGIGGVRIEDMVVVHDGCCRNLTTFNKSLTMIK